MNIFWTFHPCVMPRPETLRLHLGEHRLRVRSVHLLLGLDLAPGHLLLLNSRNKVFLMIVHSGRGVKTASVIFYFRKLNRLQGPALQSKEKNRNQDLRWTIPWSCPSPRQSSNPSDSTAFLLFLLEPKQPSLMPSPCLSSPLHLRSILEHFSPRWSRVEVELWFLCRST